MKIKVINAGNCMLCGREIKIKANVISNELPNVLFCSECENKIKENKSNERGR